jgi:hypothetical protein
MKRIITLLIIAVICLLPGIAGAQAPAQSPAAPAAPQAAPAPQPTQPACQMGPGGACVIPGQMNPEQMKQMQGKMGQCCMMQEGKGCPRHQEVQKQLDDLRQRVEALEGKKGKKK